LENKRMEQALPGELIPAGAEREWMWYKYSVYVYVNKVTSVETNPGVGEGKDKGEWWMGWIQVWHICYTVRTFVNATMYPHPEQQ
jgi:hypothetical protein